MSRLILSLAVTASVWGMPAVARDAPVPQETIERAHVRPLGPEALHRLIEGRTVTFRSLTDGSEETYRYGLSRIDREGESSEWGIVENGFIEQADGGERLVQIYLYRKRYYACSDHVCQRVIKHLGERNADNDVPGNRR